MAHLTMLSLLAAIVAPSPSFATQMLTHCSDITDANLKVVLSDAVKSHVCSREPDVVTLDGMLERCTAFCSPKAVPILIGTDVSGFNRTEMDEICTGGTLGDTKFEGLIHDPKFTETCETWAEALPDIETDMIDFVGAHRIFRYNLLLYQAKLAEQILALQTAMADIKVKEELDLAGDEEKGTIFKEILTAHLQDIMKNALPNRDLMDKLKTLEVKATKLRVTIENKIANLISFVDSCNEFYLGTGRNREYLLDICSVTSDRCIDESGAKHAGCCCGVVPAAGAYKIEAKTSLDRRLETGNAVNVCGSAYKSSQKVIDETVDSILQSPAGESILAEYHASIEQEYADFFSDCDARRLLGSGIDASSINDTFRQLTSTDGTDYLTCSAPESHTKPNDVADTLKVEFTDSTEEGLCKNIPVNDSSMTEECKKFCGDTVPLFMGSVNYGLNQRAMDEVCLSPDGQMYSQEAVQNCHDQAQSFRDVEEMAANLVAKLELLRLEQEIFAVTSENAVKNLKAEMKARGAQTIDDTKSSKRIEELKKLLTDVLSDLLGTDSQTRRRLKNAITDVKDAAARLSKVLDSTLPKLQSFMENCNVLFTGVGPQREYLLDFCSVSSKECIEDDEGKHAGCCCGYNPITALGKVRSWQTIPGISTVRRLGKATETGIDICALAYQTSKEALKETQQELKKLDKPRWEATLRENKQRFASYYDRCPTPGPTPPPTPALQTPAPTPAPTPKPTPTPTTANSPTPPVSPPTPTTAPSPTNNTGVATPSPTPTAPTPPTSHPQEASAAWTTSFSFAALIVLTLSDVVYS